MIKEISNKLNDGDELDVISTVNRKSELDDLRSSHPSQVSYHQQRPLQIKELKMLNKSESRLHEGAQI